ENLEATLLRRLKDPLHVLDGLVLGDALPDRRPGLAFLTQDVVLGIDEHDGGVGRSETAGRSLSRIDARAVRLGLRLTRPSDHREAGSETRAAGLQEATTALLM